MVGPDLVEVKFDKDLLKSRVEFDKDLLKSREFTLKSSDFLYWAPMRSLANLPSLIQ